MRLRAAATALAGLALAACVSRPPFLRPAPQRAWADTWVRTRQAADSGRWADADSLLAAFVRSYPRAPEAAEATWWRALYLLDPANPHGAPRESARLLEHYLATGGDLRHASEATTLHRTALALDSVGSAAQAAAAAATAAAESTKAVTAAREKQSAEELQKAKDELARTQAELDRIKKRLAKP